MTSFISREFSTQLLIILNVVSRDHLKTKSFLWSHMYLLHILRHVRSTFSISGTVMAPWMAFGAPHVHFSTNGTHSEPQPSIYKVTSKQNHTSSCQTSKDLEFETCFFHRFTWHLSLTCSWLSNKKNWGLEWLYRGCSCLILEHQIDTSYVKHPWCLHISKCPQQSQFSRFSLVFRRMHRPLMHIHH